MSALCQAEFPKLGEILVRRKLLTPSQVAQMVNKQQQLQKRLGELLIEENLISPRDLDDALQEQFWRRNGYWIIG